MVRLRFKDKNGEDYPSYTEHIVGEFTEELTTRNKECLPLEIYSVNNKVGFVPQSEQFEEAGYLNGADTSIYMIAPPNTFAYNPARLDIGSIGYQNIGHDVQISSLYEVFRTDERIDDEYLWHWFHSEQFKREVYRFQEGGVRQYFYYDKLEKTPISLPSLSEQKKIAEFLSLYDKKVELQVAKVEAFENRRKGLIQQVFSRNIQFKTSTGNAFPSWEKASMGELFTERKLKAKGGEELLSVTIANGVIRQTDSDKRDNSSEDKSNYKQVMNGDMAYNTMRMWQGAVGVSYWNGIVSPAYTIITPKAGANAEFFMLLFKTYDALKQFTIYSQGMSSDQWNLRFEIFADLEFYIPCLEEQAKIVAFFKLLDGQIQIEKEKLEAIKLVKKGLLQQMFA